MAHFIKELNAGLADCADVRQVEKIIEKFLFKYDKFKKKTMEKKKEKETRDWAKRTIKRLQPFMIPFYNENFSVDLNVLRFTYDSSLSVTITFYVWDCEKEKIILHKTMYSSCMEESEQKVKEIEKFFETF